MRLPTMYQFQSQIRSFTNQSEAINSVRDKISLGGKKILQGSDDPLLAMRIKSTQDYLEKIESYELNNTIADNRLALVDSTLQSILDFTGKSNELLIRAQNDTLNNGDRTAIAQELQGYRNALIGLANTTDSNGDFLFAGTAVKTTPYVIQANSVVYQGAQEANYIDISTNNRILYTDVGNKLFNFTDANDGSNNQNMFNMLQDIVTTLELPQQSEQDKIDFHTKIEKLDNVLLTIQTQMRAYQADLGGRQKVVADQNQLMKNIIFDEQLMLKKLSEDDLESLYLDLSQKTVLLELTEQTYMKIQETFFKLLDRSF